MFACVFAPGSPQASLLALASSFSPLVEDTAPGMVVFSIVGLGRLIGTPPEIAAGVARRLEYYLPGFISLIFWAFI